ncbi:MAG: hypothetical protein CXT66_05060, partial [Methanobacteriota archaeon]
MLRSRGASKIAEALFMIVLMISTPALTVQTGTISGALSDVDEPVYLTATGSSAVPDCDLANVTITEVYSYSSDEWFELYNAGNQTCDLGGWHIRDGDTSSGMVIDNETNISAGDFMDFSSSDGDFSFGIEEDDSILISTRNVTTENATTITTLDYYGRDGSHYSTSRDGSWELCDGEWDWNEPQEMTAGEPNICAGDPIVLYVQEDDGSWTQNPEVIPNGSSNLLWNTSNLEIGQSYYMYYSWSTPLGISSSRAHSFTADGSEIEFQMHSDEYWTCEVSFYSYIRNESSGDIIEYYDWDRQADCTIGYGQGYDGKQESIEPFKLFKSSSILVEIKDGFDYDAYNMGLNNIHMYRIPDLVSDVTYAVASRVYLDGVPTMFAVEECTTIISGHCEVNIPVYLENHVCDVDFYFDVFVLSPHGWLNIGSEVIEAIGHCSGASGTMDSVLNLYGNVTNAAGGQSWVELDGSSWVGNGTNRIQNFYWDIADSATDTEVRFYTYYENEKVMDEDKIFDGQHIYWNATVSDFDCSPNVYAYLYMIMPDGENIYIDHWSGTFDTVCEDWGDLSLHVDDLTNADNDLVDGTNDMVWNLSDLEVGEEYMFEWYTHRSSSYTATDEDTIYGEFYDSITFTPTVDYTHLEWALEAPGDWCDVDVYGYLFADVDDTQEWWDADDDTKWTQVAHNTYDMDPVCDGSDVVPFDPVTLQYKEGSDWIPVNDTTNLSVGMYQMKWVVSGLNDSQDYELRTNYEKHLNSSWLYQRHYSDGNFGSVLAASVVDEVNGDGNDYDDFHSACPTIPHDGFDTDGTPYGGSGTGLTLDVTGFNGAALSVTIVNPGSGYAVGDYVILDCGGSNAVVSIDEVLLGFESEWTLSISEWSCHIDYEYDLYLIGDRGSLHHQDHEIGTPVINGPCNDPIDVDDENKPEFSLSVVYSDYSEDDLDEVAALDEGINIIRWEIEDPIEGYEHMIHLYANYNGKRQEVHFDSITGGASDESGLWELTLEGDVCNLYVYGELYVKESNHWQHVENLGENLGYSGNRSGCDYSPTFTVSKELSDGSWDQNPEALEFGVNQLRFDLSNVDLMDDMTYYVNAYVQSDGGSSVGFSTYFNVGNPSNPSYSSYSDFFGEDIYLNFTVNDWTCTAYAYGNVYYITPNGGWHSLANMQSIYFDTPACDSAGNLSLSKYSSSLGWDDLDDVWEITSGTTDLYWIMDDLVIGELYQLSFSVYSDSDLIYQNAGDEWFADANNKSWYFPITIDESVCNLYGHAYLRLYVDNSFQEIRRVNINTEEPCVPSFDILFADNSGASGWSDAMSTALPVGETQMLFDISDFGPGDYEVDYYWGSENGGNGWYNENSFTVNDTNDGFYWNISLDEGDCFAYAHVRIYEMIFDERYQVAYFSNINLVGPCLLPAVLLTAQNSGGPYIRAGSDTLELGTNHMRWDLDNLQVGSDYEVDYYWYSTTHDIEWATHDFTHDGSDIDWLLNTTVWDCSVYVRVHVYDSNGVRFHERGQSFNPDGCTDGGDVSLEANRTYGWTNTNQNHNVDNGSNELRWALSDLETDFNYTMEWLTYRNGDFTQYDSFEFTADSLESNHEFTLEIEEAITCELSLQYYLSVEVGGKIISVESGSFSLNPSCTFRKDFLVTPILVLDDNGVDWIETDYIENGNQTIRIDLSGLDANQSYTMNGNVCTTTVCESFNWGTFSPTDWLNASEEDHKDFDIIVDEWSCEVSVYIHMHMITLNGSNNRHILGDYTYLSSPCFNPGDVELEIDGDEVGYSMGLENGTNDMSWNLTDLAANQTYTFDWRVRFNGDYVMYDSETWFSGSDLTTQLNWMLDFNSTFICNAQIYWRTFLDSSNSSTHNWIEMDSGDFYESFPCDEYVYPDDHYVNVYGLVNGTWEQEPGYLPTGDNDLELRFENLTVGADYRIYFYHSGSGFDSYSEYTYFTYEGAPLEMPLPIAPWACDISYSWDIYLNDFRYPDSYNSWHLGSDSGSLDGPCESVSYDNSQEPGFNASYDEDSEFVAGTNSITLVASNLQLDFPYYMESKVYFDGYLNVLEYSTWFGVNETDETLSFDLEIPGHVCDVNVYSRMYVRTSSGNTQIASNDTYDMDGPCDDTDGDSKRAFPLYAQIDGSWTLVDDDTLIEPGETQMYWNLSSLEDDERVYFYFNAPSWSWGDYVTADDGLIEWTLSLSEFECNPSIYSYINLWSPWTGSHSTGGTHTYPATECIDGGNITLEVVDDGGAAIETYQSGQGGEYHLLPGTTHFSWSLDGLVDGYQYELYWYQDGSDGNQPHFEYFTADNSESAFFFFDLTIDEYECNVYYYAYLRPMSEVTGSYEQVESFSFHPEEPCYPPFDVLATDASGDFTVDALHPDFALAPGENHLFFDFSNLDNGSEYRLEWYYEDSEGWFGWFYDGVPDGIQLNMTMDFWDCDAYFYTQLYNMSEVDSAGNGDYMEGRTRYLQGPCLDPLALQVNGTESDQHGMQLDLGDNDMTWAFDHLTTGVDYRLQWYWSNESSWNGWFYDYFTYNGSNDLDWNLHVSTFDCNPYAYASIYYDDNGTSVGDNQYWYFHVPDCSDPWMEIIDSEGDEVDSDDIEIDDEIDLVWVIHDLPDLGYEYTLDMRFWENGNLVDYRYESFNFSSADTEGDVHIDLWSGMADNDVCELRIESTLYVLSDESSNDWNSIEGYSRYFYPDCEPLPGEEDNFATGDGNYVNFYGPDADGNLVELDDDPAMSSYIMPAGENTIEIQFENLTVGADYRLYLYHSGTGFPDESNYHYFTYDGSGSMDWDVLVAPWACDVYFSWNMYLYDFRYPDSGHISWHLRSDSTNSNGPCESVSYDSSQETDFNLSYDENTQFDTGNNTVTISAVDLQDMFPYAAEL